jgi:hypothetical protein
VVILNGDRNKGQEVSVLMAFLELNHRYSTEMEREAGSGRRKMPFPEQTVDRTSKSI